MGNFGFVFRIFKKSGTGDRGSLWNFRNLWSSNQQMYFQVDTNDKCVPQGSMVWTVELGAPSPSLMMTPNCVAQVTWWREGITSTGTWTG